MKFLLTFIALTVVSALPVPTEEDERIALRVLVGWAQEIISGAEEELVRHMSEGRQHLTQQFEAEVESVRVLARELLAMDHEVVLELKKVHEYEERLLRASGRLAEHALAISNRYDEEQHASGAEKHYNEEVIPEMLISKAQAIITSAEAELANHITDGKGHLVIDLKLHIAEVKKLVKELETLEQSQHLDIYKVHEVDERLLHVTNLLAEEALIIFNRWDEVQKEDDLIG